MKWRGRRGSSNIKDLRGRGGRIGGGLRGGSGGLGGTFRTPRGGGGLGGTLGKVILGEALRRGTNSIRNRGSRGGTYGRSGTRNPIGTRSGGGIGIGFIILLAIAFFALRSCGFDPLGGATGQGPVVIGQQSDRSFEPQVPDAFRRSPENVGTRTPDEIGQFISVVLADTEEIWNGIFEAEGLQYQEPNLVLFRDSVPTACGTGQAASGPFYCPGDNQIYLDTSFFDTLANRFGAQGDFAQAYVIAHEVGHHVQNLTGVLPEFNRLRRSLSKREENATSVRVELQADCYAGLWAHYQARNGYLDDGDINEAVNAAISIGDDAIQGPYANPDNFNHGTSEQRRSWFLRGYETGRAEACDTFNARV